MLSDLEVSLSEIIILENLKRAAYRITDLEDLDEDCWSTVANLCKKLEGLERSIRDLEEKNKDLAKANKDLTEQVLKINNTLEQRVEFQKEN